jgi:hypothetical protein
VYAVFFLDLQAKRIEQMRLGHLYVKSCLPNGIKGYPKIKTGMGRVGQSDHQGLFGEE